MPQSDALNERSKFSPCHIFNPSSYDPRSQKFCILIANAVPIYIKEAAD